MSTAQRGGGASIEQGKVLIRQTGRSRGGRRTGGKIHARPAQTLPHNPQGLPGVGGGGDDVEEPGAEGGPFG